MTRILPLLAAFSLVALTGCDAAGPEAVSSKASVDYAASTDLFSPNHGTIHSGTGEITPEERFVDAPRAVRPSTECTLEVLANSPALTWRTSGHFIVVGESSDHVTFKVVGEEGATGQVRAYGEDWAISTSIEIDSNAPDC